MRFESILHQIVSGRDTSGRDLVLFALLVGLACTGFLVLYPASAVVARMELADPDFYVRKQAAWFLIGLVGLVVAASVPLDILERLALPGLALTLLFLLVVFVPGVGHSVSSSRETFYRWVSIGPFRFQPSEFAKVAVVLYSANILARRGALSEEREYRRLLLPGGFILAVIVCLILEPQYGTALTLLAVVSALVFLSGFPMLRLFLILLSALPVLYLLILLWEYRLERLRIWLDPFAYRHEGGYQLVTSFRAFHEGGFLGQDLASGFAHRYLTFGHTDFVLALLAEDYGLLGVLFLVCLYGAFLWRGFSQVIQVEEPFAFLVGSGCLVMLIAQAILNMAVVTGLVPTTGVSLPFVSYGGSSLIVSMILGGLLLNVSRGVRVMH